MYASIRRYEGLSRDTIEEVIKRSREGFVPIISASAGFISYNFIDSGDGVVATISVFETKAAAEESNKASASWVKEALAEFATKPPEITTGEVKIAKSA
jgi:hypothetical protein